MNKQDSEKPKLREINQLSSDAQGYDYGFYGSCGCCGCGSGLGTGPNDCMSQEMFLALSDKGALTSEVYVCGWGWTLPGTTIYGSCGCGSCGSCGSCGCCGESSGSGWGSGDWGSSGSGGVKYGGKLDPNSGGSGSYPQTIQEAREYNNIVNNRYVQDVMVELWNDMLKAANSDGRREFGCWIFFDVSARQYRKGVTRKGDLVSGDAHASINRGSTDKGENGLGDYAVTPISFIHTHTTLSHEYTSVTHYCGPSEADKEALQDGEYGILLDYKGKKDDYGRYFTHEGHKDDDPVVVYVYDNKNFVLFYDFNI